MLNWRKSGVLEPGPLFLKALAENSRERESGQLRLPVRGGGGSVTPESMAVPGFRGCWFWKDLLSSIG